MSSDTTTGMSPPPIAITRCAPRSSASAVSPSSRCSACIGSAPQPRMPSATRAADAAEVEQVPPGQEQRPRADGAAQLAERDHRAGEGHRADEDADLDLDVVRQLDGAARLHERADADEHRGHADEAVQHRDELGHRRHLHARGDEAADERADGERAAVDGEHVVGRARGLADLEPEQPDDADGHGQHHADDAEPVAPLRRALRRQPAQAEDEEDAGDEIDDGRER